MKIQSLILASMFSLIGTTAIYSTAYAETPAVGAATALCNDGTSYTGESKKGACSGHKGIKDWYGSKAPVAAAPVAAKATTTAPDKAATTAKPMAAPTAVAAGGGAGKVWVNDKSKTYHCEGTAYYGKTKSGSYMTEAEAKAKGNHADHGKACK
ncbi:MAG: hypothetical protein V4493_00410 [Pseudomonadota bacterium]